MDFLSFKISGLDCNQVCNGIQRMINKYVESGKVIDNSLIDIRIVNISHDIEIELPKIPEAKEQEK